VQYTTDSPEFSQVRQHAAGLKAFTQAEIEQGAQSGQWAQLNQRNGATFNPNGPSVFPTAAEAAGPPQVSSVSLKNVAPSHRTVVADLGPMRIHRPENWLLTLPEQQGQFVTIAPQAGIAKEGVGYGVLLNGITAKQVQGMSIGDVTARLMEMMQKNNGLKPMGNPQPINVAGAEGRFVMLQSPSPFPGEDGSAQPERDWLVTVPQCDGAVIFMIFIAPEAHFPQFKPAFDAMLKSIQFK